MEIIAVTLPAVLLLCLAAAALLAGRLTWFSQQANLRGFQRDAGELLARFAARLSAARSQLYRRNQELEVLGARLRGTAGELERLNNMKTKFFSMAVHDMRTPLSAVKGFAQIAKKRATSPEERTYLGHIDISANRLARLLSDLTDIAQIEAGKLRLTIAPFDFAQLVREEVLPPVSLAAGDKGIELSCEGLPEAWVVEGDRFRLSQVLMNFLGNALKFTPKGGRVKIVVRAASEGLLVQIRDTGPGLHPGERKQVFEKFYQSPHQKDAGLAQQGWGMGLSIASEVVRSHGGRIGADSPGLGRGSTFWFQIPARQRKKLTYAVWLLPILSLAGLWGVLRAEVFPVEEQVRYERAVEAKVEAVLDRLLGPNQAKVAAQATLDFRRTEKLKVQGSQGSPSAGLPGMPDVGEAGPRDYEKLTAYPSDFVKRLVVTVVLNRRVSSEQTQRVRTVVAKLLDMNVARGDVLTVMDVPFPPAWQTFLSDPESARMVFKYALITLMSLLAIFAVILGFLKLASALNSMSQPAQEHRLSMEVGGGLEGGPGGLPVQGGAAAGGGLLSLGAEAAGPKEEADGAYFRVRPDQADLLAEALAKEDASNIALVASHLEPKVRQAFLEALPKEVRQETLLRLSKVRFVDPEVIATLREELERRLEGASGGRKYLLEFLDTSNTGVKREFLAALEKRDPGLAREVRRGVLLPEDLLKLAGRDWTLLALQLRPEDWATALWDLPPTFKSRLKEELTPNAWKAVEQKTSAGQPPRKQIELARERLLEAALALIRAGRIENPLEQHA